jgi:hypothetical protein
MKRILPILLLAAIAACSREYTPPASPNLPEISLSRNNSITLDDIHEYLSGYKNIKDTKSASISVETVLEGADTVMYLINYQDGWELLSADRRAPRVFAIGEKGHTTIEELTSIPALKVLYDRFVESISYLKRNPDTLSSDDFEESWDDILDSRSLWTLISSTVIEEGDTVQNHLTQTRWGQTGPWNIRGPYRNSSMISHCDNGCGPVAIAQMLYYLHQKEGVPVSAYGDCYTQQYVPDPITPGVQNALILHSSDVTFYNYSPSNWAAMPLSASDTTGSFAAVSALMVQIGILLPALYLPTSTPCDADDFIDVFQQGFSINCTELLPGNVNIIANQVYSAQMPVILVVSYNHYNDHALVVDAYKFHYQVVNNVYQAPVPVPLEPGDPPYVTEYELMMETETIVSGRYFGMNWGWDGSGMDGVWFSADVISWMPSVFTFNTIDYMLYGFCQ